MDSEFQPFSREVFLTVLLLQRLQEEEGIESVEVRAFIQELADRVSPLMSASERAKLKQEFATKLLST